MIQEEKWTFMKRLLLAAAFILGCGDVDTKGEPTPTPTPPVGLEMNGECSPDPATPEFKSVGMPALTEGDAVAEVFVTWTTNNGAPGILRLGRGTPEGVEVLAEATIREDGHFPVTGYVFAEDNIRLSLACPADGSIFTYKGQLYAPGQGV